MGSNGWKTAGAVVGAGAAATAGVAAANACIAGGAPHLEPAIPGEHAVYDWDAGRVFYTQAGEGHPVLLLHSHNAAASSYEVRQTFAAFREGYRVYAPDLPGYGLSDRRPREYFADTYTRFIHDFVHDVIGEAAIVVATSLSAAHALLAIDEDAHAFSHLVAVAPTGLAPNKTSAPAPVRFLGRLAALPVWGQGVFNVVASRRGIRRHYENFIYHNPWAVTHEMVDYAWTTAHQHNARFAPMAFLNGALWVDVRAAYADVRRPLIVVWGADDRMNAYEHSAPMLAANPDAAVSIITNAGAVPHDEQPAEFYAVAAEFLEKHGAPPRVTA